MATAITGDPLMDVKNVPNGALGYIYFYFSDGTKQNGMYITKSTWNDEKSKTSIGALGTAAKLHKTTGTDGTFDCEGYDITDIFVILQQKLRHEGVDEYFNTTVIEWDPTTALGKKITNYYNCNVDSVQISSLDVDDAVKTTSFSGTYDDFEVIESYTVIDGLNIAAGKADPGSAPDGYSKSA